MSGLVETAIHRSVRAVIDRDAREAHSVFENETRINQLEVEIDDHAIAMLALQQPIAVDLRFVTMAIKINSSLERMGDIAVNLAKRALALCGRAPEYPHIDIPLIAKLAQEMIRNSLDAFVRKDASLARLVLKSDDAVDDLRDEIYAELIRFMEADGRRVHSGIQISGSSSRR